MEKSESESQTQNQTKPKTQKTNQEQGKVHVWDCGSTLYDSFELNSFNRQLDSAIHSRTMSMPHLVNRTRAPPPVQPSSAPVSKKQITSKLSRSIQKLFKSMFRFISSSSSPSQSSSSSSSLTWMKQRSKEEYYVVYDKTGSLTTIPEVPEIDFGGLSPEINSLVRKTASERFTAASSTVGISCA